MLNLSFIQINNPTIILPPSASFSWFEPAKETFKRAETKDAQVREKAEVVKKTAETGKAANIKSIQDKMNAVKTAVDVLKKYKLTQRFRKSLKFGLLFL